MNSLNKKPQMQGLEIINEELEEELTDNCSETVRRLMVELKKAIKRGDDLEKQLVKMEAYEVRHKELMNLCQAKNTEIFALERKIKDLSEIVEEKDKQIISILMMPDDFKQLVETDEKSMQTDNLNQSHPATHKYSHSMESVKSQKPEESTKLRPIENHYKDFSSTKLLDLKPKQSQYYPLFLRKPKEALKHH